MSSVADCAHVRAGTNTETAATSIHIRSDVIPKPWFDSKVDEFLFLSQ
jgi:hypothetical protein